MHAQDDSDLARATTTVTTRTNLSEKSPIDLAVLSLLLGERQSQNFTLDFLQDQSHKSFFSDDEARKNTANQLSSMFIHHLLHWIFFSILLMIF